MKHVKFIAKRLIIMVFTLLVVSFFVFMLIRLAGVDPITVLTGSRKSSEAQRQELRVQFNLDKPLLEQYGIWLKGVVQGDFGIDYQKKQSVSTILTERMPITLGLVLMSSVIAVAIALPAGILCAIKKNTWLDSLLSTIMLFFTSTPGFVSSILLLLIVVKVNPSYSFSGTYHTTGEYFERLFFPALALSFSMIALIGRIVRSNMIEQMKQGYITTTRAKGMGSGNVVMRHAFHNAVIPVLTVSTLLFGGCIANAVLVEEVFSLPGLGSALITAIQNSNYPIIQALILVLTAIFAILNLIVDILYVAIDPRIKLK